MSGSPQSPGVAILGAGIAGASAARTLADRGLRVVVHDKARTAGGRSATRAREGDHFDHGAQYFTGRDPAFVRQIEGWAAAGIVAEWQPRLVSINADNQRGTPSAERRWVGVPGMSQLAASLLGGVDVRCSSRVVGVGFLDDGWQLQLADGSVDGPYEALVCTLPAPQAAQLLAGQPLAEAAAEVAFAPCWALMLEFPTALDTGFDAAFVNVGPLSWLARDSSKPGRPEGERWVIHAGPQYSRDRLESSPDLVTVELQQAFFAAAGVTAQAPRRSFAHRWRYALAQPPLHLGALIDGARRLALGGDWCHGSRIEGAWLSGQLLARQILSWRHGES